jgi:hypothetical protein
MAFELCGSSTSKDSRILCKRACGTFLYAVPVGFDGSLVGLEVAAVWNVGGLIVDAVEFVTVR